MKSDDVHVTFLLETVPSVAPANVSGGNGRRHELVILWEVGVLPRQFWRAIMKQNKHLFIKATAVLRSSLIYERGF